MFEGPAWKFQEWARSKGLDLKRKPDNEDAYEHPLTQAAWEGYTQRGRDEQLFWQPRHEAAIGILMKNGLMGIYSEEEERSVKHWKQISSEAKAR